MKIVISQQDKKIEVIFKQNKVVDKYILDKADDFLNALDKFIKKRKIDPVRSRPAKGTATAALGRPASNGIDFTFFRGAKLEIKQARPVRNEPLQAAVAAPLAKRISNGPSLLTERIIRAILQGIRALK